MYGANVLVVEDSKFHGIIIKDILTKNGYSVTWVMTGEEAADIYEKFDLILLDVILPGISGYELCEAVKSKTPIIPVIMLTAMDDEKSLIKSLESGADDYIKKPYSVNELLARIKVQLRTRKLQIELLNKNQELQNAYNIIKKLSITDMLTGAYNRGYINEYIDKTVKNLNQNSVKIACIMVDIDNFKKVNDNYGHLTGDKVLKNVALICKECVDNYGKVIRFGGEEFLIIIDKDVEKSEIIAENIRYKCEESRCCGFIYTVSIGAKTFNADKSNFYKDLEEGIKEADKMLYVSKNNGKNKVSVNKTHSL